MERQHKIVYEKDLSNIKFAKWYSIVDYKWDYDFYRIEAWWEESSIVYYIFDTDAEYRIKLEEKLQLYKSWEYNNNKLRNRLFTHPEVDWYIEEINKILLELS